MHLPTYDNTKLVAINTCPTWGILRYSLHKMMTEHRGRAMALEMGSAAHEVFAAVRLWQLREYQGLARLADYHGVRLFGDSRYSLAVGSIDDNADPRQKSLAFCLSLLDSGSFFDDPSDRRRTVTNLEEALIQYIDRWDWNRSQVWVRDADDPASDVGIELPIDVVIHVKLLSGIELEVRFIGRCDGLHVRKGKLLLHENKTASRLDDAWRMSFAMSSQVTGYMLALPVSLGLTEAITEGEIYGTCVPLPRNNDYGGNVREWVTRKQHHFEHWLMWFVHTVVTEMAYRDDVVHAPRYTHSCNRYFRPCSMLPFCDSEEEEQKAMLEEMATDEWSPLHEDTA